MYEHIEVIPVKTRSSRLLAGILALGFTAVVAQPVNGIAADIDARMRYYEEKLEHHPRLYPIHALLGIAYLDKARATYDPTWLLRAQKALGESNRIQPNLPAYKGLAALSNYRHRFAEGLMWARRVLATRPEDTEGLAMLVEAHLGLGEVDAARALLPVAGEQPQDFYTAAALGQWLSTQSYYEQAHRMFLLAAELAGAEDRQELWVWAMVMAAGMRIDAGRTEEAKLLLRQVAGVAPKDEALLLHWAEVHAAEGRRGEALAIYQRLLQDERDGGIYYLAFRLARNLDRPALAAEYLAAAERAFIVALDAGEVYTLEALARLYCDAGVKLERAHELAQRNLRYKRDLAASELLMCGAGQT